MCQASSRLGHPPSSLQFYHPPKTLCRPAPGLLVPLPPPLPDPCAAGDHQVPRITFPLHTLQGQPAPTQYPPQSLQPLFLVPLLDVEATLSSGGTPGHTGGTDMATLTSDATSSRAGPASWLLGVSGPSCSQDCLGLDCLRCRHPRKPSCGGARGCREGSRAILGV